MRRQVGFTLIELLLVLAIIGIISAIAVPALLGQRSRARIQATKANTLNCIADLTSTLYELSEPPSERKVGLPTAIYTNDAAGNLSKANDAIANVLAKPNFAGAKNPYSSGASYMATPAAGVDGVVYVDSTGAGVDFEPLILISGCYHDNKGNAAVFQKLLPVN